MAKNEVAAVNAAKFNLMTLTADLKEAIQEEMDGLGTVPFDRVKIPSGGGLAFEVPGDNPDEPEASKNIDGVIIWHHPANAYWRDSFQGGNAAPDCSSIDGRQGLERETGVINDCQRCPHNQFGSDGRRGKACKNIHRLYMLREGNPVPMILALPPTSLKFLRDYLSKQILLKGLRSYDVITRITLKKETSGDGIAYSRAAFQMAGKLEAAQREATKAMAEVVKEMAGSMPAVDVDDYDTGGRAPAPGEFQGTPMGDGFMNIPDGVEGPGLPFN